MYWDGSVRKLQLDIKALEWIVATRTLLMQMNNRGQTKNDWLWVALQRD